MLVESSDIRIAKQHATAAIGLQAMLVRVDDNRIDLRQAVKSSFGVIAEFACEPEVAPVCGIGMHAGTIMFREFENFGERINSPEACIAQRRYNRADLAGLQQLLDCLGVHASLLVDRNRREGQAEYVADAGVCVVRLRRRDDLFARMQFAGDPKRLEIGHCAAAGQMAQQRVPAVHAANFRHAFLFKR